MVLGRILTGRGRYPDQDLGHPSQLGPEEGTAAAPLRIPVDQGLLHLEHGVVGLLDGMTMTLMQDAGAQAARVITAIEVAVGAVVVDIVESLNGRQHSCAVN